MSTDTAAENNKISTVCTVHNPQVEHIPIMTPSTLHGNALLPHLRVQRHLKGFQKRHVKQSMTLTKTSIAIAEPTHSSTTANLGWTGRPFSTTETTAGLFFWLYCSVFGVVFFGLFRNGFGFFPFSFSFWIDQEREWAFLQREVSLFLIGQSLLLHQKKEILESLLNNQLSNAGLSSLPSLTCPSKKRDDISRRK